MSVTITPRWSGASLGQQSQDNKNWQQSAQIVFDAITDSPATDTDATVMISPGCPIVRLSVHPARPWMRCSGVSINKISPIRWEVVATYTANTKDDTNPLDMPPDIEWDTAVTDEEVDEDINGQPICTVIGEPFEPHVRIKTKDLVIRIGRNIASFDPDLLTPYTMAVASDVVFGQPVGTVRMNYLRANSVQDDDFTYYRVSCELQFRRGAPRTTDDKAWWRRVRAQGYYVLLVLEDGEFIVRATDDHSQPTTVPVAHFARPTTIGDKSYKAGEQIPITSADPWPLSQWYEFEVFQSLPFSELGFF